MTAPIIPRGAARDYLRAFGGIAAIYITESGHAGSTSNPDCICGIKALAWATPNDARAVAKYLNA
jgi:hypothetical protein